MARLTEKKIDIAEEYLRNRGNRVEAIKEIDPTIKKPAAYAYKLFREPEFQEYLTMRRSEILKDSGIDLVELVKGVSNRLRESIGIDARRLVNYDKELSRFVYSEEDLHPDSKDAKNYFDILERVLGPEISSKASLDSVSDAKKQELKEAELTAKKKIEADKLKVEQHKAGLTTDKSDDEEVIYE
jgi:hypothetical protein